MVSQTRRQGSAVRGINLGDVKLMLVILPPLLLQKTFALRVAIIERLKAGHGASLGLLDSLFASLQTRAFRGRL